MRVVTAGSVVIVAAVAANRVIGAGGALPWRLPEDMHRFRTLTMGGTLLMGRRTYDSIGRPLPGRRTVVLTRDRGWSAPGVTVAHSMTEALREAATATVFVAGGAAVYASALPLADRLELTEIDLRPDGDTLFPDVDRAAWITTAREQRDGYAFVTYERRRAPQAPMRQPGSMTDPGGSIPTGPTLHDIPDVPDVGGDGRPAGEIPNPDTGVGIGAGQPSTFEPEETEPEPGDAEALPS